MSWLKRLEVHLQREELGHVLDERAPLIPVNGGGDRVVLDSRYSKGAVADHLRAFSILQSAVVNAPFESRVQACKTFKAAWEMIGDQILPRSDDQYFLMKARLENVPNHRGEDPQDFFARVDSLLVMMSAAGIEIPEKEIVRTVVRQLSSDFDVEKRSTLTAPGLSRYDVEKIIRDSYARRKAAELRKSGGSASGSPAAPAATSNPHALAVGMSDGFRQGGRGGPGHQSGDGSGGMGGGRIARGPPSSLQQQQWSRGGRAPQQQGYGPPRHMQGGYDGGAPQQQQWSRNGGASRQQGSWPSQQRQQPQQSPPWDSVFAAAYAAWYRDYSSWRQQQQQSPQQQRSRPPDPHGPPASHGRSTPLSAPPPPPPPPNSHVLPPRNASGEFNRGVGGIYDCGRNADYFQTESPPPPGKPMGWVYQCQRCGRLGHEAKDCDADRRFEGYCNICGNYGHSASRCCLRRRKPRSFPGGYPHAHVVSAAAAGAGAAAPAPVGVLGGVVDAHGCFTPEYAGDAGFVRAHADDSGEETFVETPRGAVEHPSAPSTDERRVRFEDGPADDRGGASFYAVDEGGGWNADVEAQQREHDVLEEHFAAPVSLPFGAAGGDDGEIFHPGFMALQSVPAGSCVGKSCDGPFDRGCMALQLLSPRSLSRVFADTSAPVSPRWALLPCPPWPSSSHLCGRVPRSSSGTPALRSTASGRESSSTTAGRRGRRNVFCGQPMGTTWRFPSSVTWM